MKKVIVALVLVCGMALGTIWYVVAQTNDSLPGPYQQGDLWTAEDANAFRSKILLNMDQLQQFALFFEKIDMFRRLIAFAVLLPIDGATVTAETNNVAEIAVGGTATITRTAEGNFATVIAKGLAPGDGYEIWYYHFNDPDACTSGGVTAELTFPFLQLDFTQQAQCDASSDDALLASVCSTHTTAGTCGFAGEGELCDVIGKHDLTMGLLSKTLFLPLEDDCTLTNPHGEAQIIIAKDDVDIWRAIFPEHKDFVLPEFSTNTSF
jgi:hypothetical protein